MDTLVERCCGIDIGRSLVVACLIVGKPGCKLKKEVRKYCASKRQIEGMKEWLKSEGCTTVAMESTGVYWQPIYYALEDSFEMVLGNAQHIKNVPGRKTDVKDAEWIADLVRHGLINKSYVPPAPIRELRTFTRYRKKLVDARTSERNRIQKHLETGHIKLGTVVCDVFGVSGMAMLEALVAGASSISEMAQLSKGVLRKKIPQIEEVLEGRIDAALRSVLSIQLARLKQLKEDLDRVDQAIAAALETHQNKVALLKTIPGIDDVLAARIIAETGGDMAVFRSAGAFAAWAGVCPGNHESAGKHTPVASRKGNEHLKTSLVEAANAAVHKKTGYLRTKFIRLKGRRGFKRALVAIAHKIAIAAYYVLKRAEPYKDLGDAYLDSIDKNRVVRALTKRLQQLGLSVRLSPAQPTPAN